MRHANSTSGGEAATQDVRAQTEDQRKSAEEWQLAIWRRWPRHDDWPGKLDLYEFAAYLRVSPSTLRRATETDRADRAHLRHQRIGSAYRIDRRDLDTHGLVDGRNL